MVITKVPGRGFVILCLLFLGSYGIRAQGDPLRVKYNFIVDDGDKIGAKLVIEKDGHPWRQRDEKDGKGVIDLDYQHDYVMSFSKPGFITKKIAVSTKLPKKMVQDGFAPLLFDVTIFKQYDGINIVVFNQPVARYAYLEDKDDFGYDTDYTKSILAQVKKAEDELKEKHKEDKGFANKVNNQHKNEVGEGIPVENTSKSSISADHPDEGTSKNKSSADEVSKNKAGENNDYRGMTVARTDANGRDRLTANTENTDKRNSLTAGTESTAKDGASAANGMADSHIEKEYVEGNKRTTEITITRKGRTMIYKKVAYVWGVYYFRDGLNITETTYIQEAL